MKEIGYLLMSLALCGAVAATSWDERMRTYDGIKYTNLDGTYFERFILDKNKAVAWWQSGQIESKHGNVDGGRDTYFGIDMTKLNDCSDDSFRCVYGAHQVFAVPRNNISNGSSFVAGGAIFHVEKCLYGNDMNCELYLISSDCQRQGPPDKCIEEPMGRSASVSVGRVGYFIYDEHNGITSYGSADKPIKAADSQLAVACEMLLQSKTGLLFQGRRAAARIGAKRNLSRCPAAKGEEKPKGGVAN